jgi:putative FmdB family regulatory protein
VPLYEYECGKCGKRFEVIQKFSDDPLSVCKFCKGPATRLLSSPAFHFKGTGWYVTDYAKKSTSEPAAPADGKSKKEEAKPATAAAETAKESKSAGDSPAASSSSSAKE